MKLRLPLLALMTALGSACTSTDKPRSTLDVKPVLAVRHGTQDAQSHYQLGRYYHGQNRLAQAEAAYMQATALDARHVDAVNALGSLYAERGELERAVETMRKATEMAPDAAYIYNNLGYASYLLGRSDQAYAALYRALSLDSKLERAWTNLQRIAARHPAAALAEGLAARRVDLLPTELPKAMPAAVPAKPAPAAPPAAEPPALADDSGNGEAGGSLAKEPAANGGTIATAQAEPAGPAAPMKDPTDFSTIRIEVSNGNGVARFARKFSAQLRADSIPVARITNLGSFLLKETVIEYQPGHAAAAQALMARIGLAVRLVPAIRQRPRSDIRVALGKDALQLALGAPEMKMARK